MTLIGQLHVEGILRPKKKIQSQIIVRFQWIDSFGGFFSRGRGSLQTQKKIFINQFIAGR